VIALAFGYAVFGLIGIGVGVLTYKRAGELSEANRVIAERFIPARAGRALGAPFGPLSYRVAGWFVIGVGGLVLMMSLVG
jgi:hypothetical protein